MTLHSYLPIEYLPHTNNSVILPSSRYDFFWAKFFSSWKISCISKVSISIDANGCVQGTLYFSSVQDVWSVENTQQTTVGVWLCFDSTHNTFDACLRWWIFKRRRKTNRSMNAQITKTNYAYFMLDEFILLLHSSPEWFQHFIELVFEQVYVLAKSKLIQCI